MSDMTPEGRALVNDLAQRYHVSADAVQALARAVVAGNGSMAQFNHPELGGGGQWMAGGMTMVGDMFNNNLRGTVDNICSSLANAMGQGTRLFIPPKTRSGSDVSFQFQGYQSGNWWPDDLGSPSSTGAQNNTRYAYFPNTRRLAIDTGREVLVFDTLDHQIGGFGQQQGSGASLTFTSQYGLVSVDNLPRVNASASQYGSPQSQTPQSQNSQVQNPQVQSPQPQFTPPPQDTPPQYANPQNQSSDATGTYAQGKPLDSQIDVFATIERLKDLHDKGILSEAEFQAKKTELLSRL